MLTVGRREASVLERGQEISPVSGDVNPWRYASGYFDKSTGMLKVRNPLLHALGGQAKTADVLAGVEERMRSRLGPRDRERLAGGDVRWRKAAQWTRFEMVEEGLIRKDSPRGIWEIAPEGKKRAKLERRIS